MTNVRKTLHPTDASGQDDQGTDVSAERGQRQRADRADDDPVDRDPAEPLDRPAIDRPLEVEPDGGELDDDAADDGERKEREHLEEVRAEKTERPPEHLQQCDADGDRHAEEYRRSSDLCHPPPLVHRCVVGTGQMVIDVQIFVQRRMVDSGERRKSKAS